MTYEEAVRRFAAQTFDVTYESVERAEIDMEYEPGCPTCGGGSAAIWLSAVIDGRAHNKEFRDLDDVIPPLIEISIREAQ